MRRSEKAQHLIRTRIKDARTGESKVNIEENKIKNVIDNIPTGSFTVLDFMKTLRLTCPEDYETLVKRFGTFGMKRRYTVTRYLSNRLDLYPRNPHSILVPFTRYKQGKFTDYRITTEEERKIFGSQWTAVYKKKPKKTENRSAKPLS